ncbi:MAG: hypothetical protein B6I36_09560 [Desulfobacteraceae bacterium 4572_35.1]|nr:MAG: hypothetical protein B6I36_09560 [Desulfobacteraceae bacterium 4572_35.1]
MTKLNIAAQLKQAFEDSSSFDNHPLQRADNDVKLNYLKALSMIVYADKNRTEGETAFLGALYRSLNPSDIVLDNLFSFAENPTLSDISQMVSTLSTQDEIGISFLLDAAMLVMADGNPAEEELALIGAYRPLLGWNHTIYNRWYSYCAAFITGEDDAVLAKFPHRCTDHILQYRKLKRLESDLSEEPWSNDPLPDALSSAGGELQLGDYLAAASSDSMALKVKAALERVTVLSYHPLKDAALEDKMNYLKALSLVLVADGVIVAEEQAYFGAITRTLVSSDMLAGLLEYANNPDLTEVVAMVETMAKDENYKHSLLLDAAMLAYVDGELHEDEDELIAQFLEMFGWTKDEFLKQLKVVKAICTAVEGVLLNSLLCEVPDELGNHILEYRGLSGTAISPSVVELGIEFVTLENMRYGKIVNGKKISANPITVGQFSFFLRFLMMVSEVLVSGSTLRLESGEDLVEIDSNGLSLVDGQLVVASVDENNSLVGISPFAASRFCEWLSLGKGENYDIPQVTSSSDRWVSQFAKNSYFLLVRYGKKIRPFPASGNSYMGGQFVKISEQKPLNDNKLCEGSQLYIVITSSVKKADFKKISSPMTNRTRRRRWQPFGEN